MTYTHPYLSTPYTLCVDIEPRGTQHSSFLLPVAGVCTLATPSPLPCVTPPQGEFIELEQSGGVETRSQEQEGRLRNKEATPGAAPGAPGWPHQGQHKHSALCLLNGSHHIT